MTQDSYRLKTQSFLKGRVQILPLRKVLAGSKCQAPNFNESEENFKIKFLKPFEKLQTWIFDWFGARIQDHWLMLY